MKRTKAAAGITPDLPGSPSEREGRWRENFPVTIVSGNAGSVQSMGRGSPRGMRLEGVLRKDGPATLLGRFGRRQTKGREGKLQRGLQTPRGQG